MPLSLHGTLPRLVVLTIAFVCCGLWSGCDDADATRDVIDRDTDVVDAEPPNPLDPQLIPRFVSPMPVPLVMPETSRSNERTVYRIAMRQFEQQILPDELPATTVWGYGPADGGPFHSPSLTVEARVGEHVEVTWINDLVDDAGRFLPHLLPVDQTVHWANPAGPIDSDPDDPSPYTGPVPLVPHLHGAHVESHSDGLPDAWYLPDAVDIPEGYTHRGSFYDSVVDAPLGEATFEYPHDQGTATRWFHDHALGITRINVYAGLAGFWLVRDDAEDALDLPGPAPAAGDAVGTRYYELPIAIQDRSFYDDGSLRYPTSRAEFDGYTGPYEPDSEISPVWVPEFFGDTLMVNGRTWPFLEVEPRLYRLRLLNGCNARFLVLRFDPALDFHQIGNEGGLLPDAPVVTDTLLLAPAERADVIVDFSQLSPGTTVTLLNLGPDEPYKGPGVELEPADPETTGQVMQLRVVAGTGEGNPGRIPDTLPARAPLSTTLAPRDLTLNEEVDPVADVPAAALLGTVSGGAFEWEDRTTETPALNTTEVWRIANLTEDAHPIHLHQVLFQVLERRPFDAEAFANAQAAWLEDTGPEPVLDDYFTGPGQPPEPGELGRKDTVIANPGEVLSIVAHFDIAGRFVWHCHILEHEDNSMMRVFEVR